MGTEDKLRSYLKRVTVELAQTRERLAELEERWSEPIAIIGMACRLPGGDTVEGFWDLLREGRSSVREVPASRWNIDDYYDPDPSTPGAMYTRYGMFLDDVAGWDAEFFGLSPREALRVDPQQRLLLELAWEGLENAGLSPTDLAGSRTGVMVGLMDTLQYGRIQIDGQGAEALSDPYTGQGAVASVASGRVAYQLDLTGPTLTVDTACSSSLVATHLAAESLRRGDCDLALAAGVALSLHPDLYVQACAGLMMSADGVCKTFDERADGYVMGEGGGVVVLEPLSKAISNGRRIRAVLRGSAVNQDGRSNGLTAPSRRAQVDVISRAQAAARVTPDEIDYVESHGSGTHLGDAIELSALHDVFGDRDAERPLWVGAVKTNIGHTQAAAGVSGLIKTTLILENGLIPTNLHQDTPAEAIPESGGIRPVTETVPMPRTDKPRLAGVSSFGLSGTNAHLVLESAPDLPAETGGGHLGEGGGKSTEPADGTPVAHSLPLSAATEPALRSLATRLAGWLADRPDTAIADLAHTLQTGRATLDHRRVLVCTDLDDAIRALRSAAESGAGHRVTGNPRIAFLLQGVGDQYAGIGRVLYAREPVYKEMVDHCVELVRRQSGLDLLPLFFPEADHQAATEGGGDPFAALRQQDEHDPLDRAAVAHPFLFIVEYALAKLLRHWGVTPDLLIGYSLGEYVAACLAGVFTLDDALHLVVERAHLISTAPPGRMVAAAASEEEVRTALPDTDVDIAASNGPLMTVLSGLPEEIEAATAVLGEQGIACRPLRSAHAFHSRLLHQAREKLANLIEGVPRHAPEIPIVSNLTGRPLTTEQATGTSYWADQLVSTVRFADGIGYCVDKQITAFVELGAGQTLGGLVRQNLTGGPAPAVVGTLPPRWTGSKDPDELAATRARLWELGAPVRWERTRPPGGRILSLPGYPFQRTRFWPELSEQPAMVRFGSASAPEPAPRRGVVGAFTFVPTWQRDPAPRAQWRPADPLVVFADTGGIGAALADLADDAGVPVVEVIAAAEPGTAPTRDGRRLTIDPAVPEHYAEVFAPSGDGPVQVVHLWNLDSSAAGDEELRAAMGHGFHSLMLALQAMGETRPGRLLTVSRGATDILGGDTAAPQQALAHGVGRAIRHENAGLVWSGVDLDPETESTAAAPREQAAQLAAELGSQVADDADLAGWRRGHRWLRSLTQVPDAPEPASPVWRADGTYLITGGTRGLGMALAKHLVRSGVRRLALVGRTPLTRPGPGADEPTGRAAETLRDVAELEGGGAEVLLLTADTGEPDQLRSALSRARAHFGALHGVIHSAGLPAGGLLQRRTVAGAAEVIAPKVLAMGPLAEAVGGETPPELLVLYSSAVTQFGGIGEGDYCAANSVLDAYGQALAATAPSTRVVSVAWGPWQHDVWQSEGLKSSGGLAERIAAYRAEYGFPEDAGCALLDRIVAGGHGAVVAVRQPIKDIKAAWAGMLDLSELVGSSGPSGERFPRPQLRADYVAPRNEAETRMAELWGAYLGIDRVGIHDPFFDLGGNSLLGMAMVRDVEKEWGKPAAPALLFEHATVAEFTAALEGAASNGEEALTAGSARGQRRRRARSGGRRGER